MICFWHPVGWTFKKNGKLEVRKEGAVTIYGVRRIPYLSHVDCATWLVTGALAHLHDGTRRGKHWSRLQDQSVR